MSITTIEAAESYIFSLNPQVRDYESRLAHVKTILASLGSPQNNTPAIHIAGTSGKGSTSYYTSSLLINSGYKVGLIVSPHVHSVKERCQINGEVLSDKTYLNYLNQFIEATKDISLSYIEFVIIFAFWVFTQEKVNYQVVEVGMGGRLDPTNIMTRPRTVRGITDIGFDHVEFLGNTLQAIATEKAGIIHEGDSILLNSQPDEVIDAIKQKAAEKNAHLRVLTDPQSSLTEGLPSFQRRNWQLAYALASKRLKLDKKQPLSNAAITASLATTIPGRFEEKTIDDTTVLLDAAHNPQKINALVDSLAHHYPDKKPVIITAFGANKADSAKESLTKLASLASAFIVTEFNLEMNSLTHKAIPAENLAVLLQDTVPVTTQKNLNEALRNGLALAKQHHTYVVVTGSFYLLDNIYPLLKEFEKSE